MTAESTPTAYTTSSRYGATRSLSPLGAQPDGTRQYILWGESRYVRGGHGMIDFEGGPFVCTGEFINPDSPDPIPLVEAVGAFPCIDPAEIVVGAQWMDAEDAAHALKLMRPNANKNYYYALITTKRA